MFTKQPSHSTNSKSNNLSPFQKRSDGNAFIQPKLNIGKPGDNYEVEADRTADAIVSMKDDRQTAFFSPSPIIQQQAKTEEEEIQAKAEAKAEEAKAEAEEEENVQAKAEAKAEEEEVQAKSETDIETQNKELAEPQFQQKPETAAISPVVQTKAEEEIQEKEEEDEEPVQTKLLLQKSEEPDTNVEEEPLPVQAKSDGGKVGTTSIESHLNSSKGGGSPLNENVQTQMESGFGTDFSNVRVHTDSTAVQMNKNLGAQAFTHGSDIYFNEGKYNPESDSGKHLLAHELTHTVQQGASVQTNMVQKADDEIPVSSPQGSLEIGEVDSSSNTITYNEVRIPSFKGEDHRALLYNGWNLKRDKRYNSNTRPSNQQQIWKNNIITQRIETQLEQKAINSGFQSQSGNYLFKSIARPITTGGRHQSRGQSHYYIGTLQEIAKSVSAPAWNRRGSASASMEVDHIVELQISGYPDTGGTPAHAISNMELLERRPNQQSGDFIKGAINDKVESTLSNNDTKRLLEQEIPELSNTTRRDTKRNLVKRSFNLIFNSYTASGGPRINENSFWSKESIESGEHLNQVNTADFSELGEQGRLLVFPTLSGGVGKTFIWNGNDSAPNRGNNESGWLKPFEITSKRFSLANVPGEQPDLWFGEFQIQIPENKRDTFKELRDTVYIERIPGADFAGRLNKSMLQRSAEKIELEKASPITIDYIDFAGEHGITLGGKVLPTIPFISNAQLEYRLQGDDLSVFKTLDIGDFDSELFSPFIINSSNLTLEISIERGFAISGLMYFGINNVGEGHIGAAASTAGGFELEGAFNFDSELFDPAEINVEYKDNIWTIGGEIGIPEGKVRGVKNATITASYSENNFTASGNAELDIPGIERGTMTVNYGDEGFSIGGNFDLSSDIPGIQGGNVEARVSKEEGAENYDVFVSGTAQPDIPGIDTSLTVTYENGALSIEGSAAYNRGMLSGNVNIGATNRTIGEDGEPTGEPDDTMRVYGGGDLTLQLTPWLQATAGVQFLPNGEIEITGRIALPSTVDVFDRREFRRNLFTVPTIEIPLFAIPLGPRSLGLVAQIGGGLDFSAGFGPGQLRDVFAEVTYNPDREDETEIHGHGIFAIPADAGLTLRGDLGLGLSIAIASLSGGIELAGTLGLEGEAAAEADITWSPQTGVVLDAEGSITVNPKFIFEINAFARASLGIGWFSISETWRHNLASFSWGPDIRFGIVFPVHYQEDQPFDISFDDIEVIYPDLDVVDMAVDLARDIKDDIFD